MKNANILVVMIAACGLSVPLCGETIGQIYARGRQEGWEITARHQADMQRFGDSVIASGQQIPPPPCMTWDMFPDFTGGLAKNGGGPGMSAQRQMPPQNGQMTYQVHPQGTTPHQGKKAYEDQFLARLSACLGWFDSCGAVALETNPDEFLLHIQGLQQLYVELVSSELAFTSDNLICLLTRIVNLQNV
jgi:hypothetical protein